LFEKDRRSF
jgi:hypothetical protein